MIRRLLHRLDRLVTRRVAREFTKAGVPHGHLTAVGDPVSVSPLSLVDRYHATGLPTRAFPHCKCCVETFSPAPCPITHTEGPCRVCDGAA
jgi:hypothetical protein